MLKKVNKYNSKKILYENILFASKLESQRYFFLQLAKKQNAIKDFELQVPLQITINDKKICKYICDFVIITNSDKKLYEDVKGFKTPVYRLKKKLVEANFNIKIHEITKDNLYDLVNV